MLHCSKNSTPVEFLRSLSWLEKKKKNVQLEKNKTSSRPESLLSWIMGLELPLRMVGNIVITNPTEKSGLSFSKQI